MGWLLGLLLGFGSAPGPLAPLAVQAEETAATEYQLKAAWLLNFARFIDWPAEAFEGTADPLIVGVLGKDPFGKSLEQTFAGKTVKGRALLVNRFPTEQDLKCCNILFISTSEKRRHREILARLKQFPILTVSETDEFLDYGGVINFAHKEGSVRFVVNLTAARPARLKISASLLKLALSVKGKYE
jgi:hypothetical protein